MIETDAWMDRGRKPLEITLDGANVQVTADNFRLTLTPAQADEFAESLTRKAAAARRARDAGHHHR